MSDPQEKSSTIGAAELEEMESRALRMRWEWLSKEDATASLYRRAANAQKHARELKREWERLEDEIWAARRRLETSGGQRFQHEDTGRICEPDDGLPPNPRWYPIPWDGGGA